MRTSNLLAACVLCAGVLPAASAADNWPPQTQPAAVIAASHVMEREQLLNRLGDYRMPSASSLAREITLEIVTNETRTVSLPPLTPIALEF